MLSLYILPNCQYFFGSYILENGLCVLLNGVFVGKSIIYNLYIFEYADPFVISCNVRDKEDVSRPVMMVR